MNRHGSIETVLQLLAVGAEVPPDEASEALASPQAARLTGSFEVGRAAAWDMREEDSVTAEMQQVDSEHLFECALVKALDDPDTITRLRAAQRLGTLDRLGFDGIVALARTVKKDPEHEVRAAALAALDALDEAVALSQRIVDAWAADPTAAASYLDEVLNRLAAERADQEVAVLRDPVRDAKGDVLLTGETGLYARISIDRNRIWMTIAGIPDRFNESVPWVAFPSAVANPDPALTWTSGLPGLAAAAEPVREGSSRVLVAEIESFAAGAAPHRARLSTPNLQQVFSRAYLLHNVCKPALDR